MFKSQDEKRSSVYNLLWKYKGYNLKLTEKEFEKKGYNIHKRKKTKVPGDFDEEHAETQREIKKATRNDYEMLTKIKRDLFRKTVSEL